MFTGGIERDKRYEIGEKLLFSESLLTRKLWIIARFIDQKISKKLKIYFVIANIADQEEHLSICYWTNTVAVIVTQPTLQSHILFECLK